MSAWRRRVRSALDRALASSGLLAWRERAARRSLAVLTYHRVLPRAECAATSFPGLAMPLDAFEAQLAWLAEHARVLPLGEALVELERGPRERPLVALTFDDGYADNAEHAAPALAAHGLRASFFVTTGFLEGRPLWFERAASAWARADEARRAEALGRVRARARAAQDARAAWIEALKRVDGERRAAALDALEATLSAPLDPALHPRPLSLAQLRSLADAGHEVGAHGSSHALLVGLSPTELERELREPRERLEGWLGAPPRGLCYPNGDADTRVAEAARQAGYAYACTTRPGVNPPGCEPFFLARTDLAPHHVHAPSGEHDLLLFRCELAGLHEVFR